MKVITSLALVILLSTFSSAIVINEFTVDPQTDWDNSGSATTSDEWIELYNPSNETVNLTNWILIMDDSLTTNASIETLDFTLQPNEYAVILNPEGSMSQSGQIILRNTLNQLVDSVTYGTWDDGNPLDNAQEGGADSYEDECLTRIPNGQDTDIDSEDFIKTECTYNSENDIIEPNEQGIIAIIGGKIVFKVLPRLLDFGTVELGSINNNATNGPIIFDTNGSTTDVRVEVTNVTGFPFEEGLKMDGVLALGQFWNIPQLNPIKTVAPTLDVQIEAEPGEVSGTITYTVTGLPPA